MWDTVLVIVKRDNFHAVLFDRIDNRRECLALMMILSTPIGNEIEG